MAEDTSRDAETEISETPDVAAPVEEAAPVETVEAPNDDRPKTVREALERAARDLTRDEKGRFAKKNSGETDFTGQVSADGEAVTDAEASTPSLEAPQQWPASAKDAFKKLPADAKQFLLERHSAMEGDYTRKTQELAARARQYAALDQVMEQYGPELTQIGYTPDRLIHQFMSVQKWLDRDAPSCLSWLARSYGLTFGQLAQREQQTQSNVDPALLQLQQELYNIKSRLEQTDEQSQQARVQSVENEIVSFATEKDSAGNLVRPHFEALQKFIIPLVTTLREEDPDAPHREILAKAYDMAVYANPETRSTVDNARKLEAAKATKRAAVSVNGAPGGSVTQYPTKKDTRSLLEYAWSQTQRV